MPARSVPDTVTTAEDPLPVQVLMSNTYVHTLELVELIATLVTPLPIVIVGAVVMSSEKVAVTVTVVSDPNRSSASLSVKVTVGVLVSIINVVLVVSL